VAKTEAFDVHHLRYEAWFEHHRATYHAELLAVRTLLPRAELGLEIGVGSGRFAAPLGVPIGIDPSASMLQHAGLRGIAAVQGVAEALPFRDASFDYALMVTTLCFLDDVPAALTEAMRVLKPAGALIIGFIDTGSSAGAAYLERQADSPFYREARFHTAAQLAILLKEAGFHNPVWVQTLSRSPDESAESEAVKPGYGEGAFAAVRAIKPNSD